MRVAKLTGNRVVCRRVSSNLHSAVALVLALVACGGDPLLPPAKGPLAPPEDPAPAPIAMEQARSATRLALLGTEIEVPAGFFYAERPNHTIRIETPDRKMTVVLTLVEGEDATRALEQGWARGELQKPGGTPEEYRAAPNEEWDEIVQLDYPGETAMAFGNARRKGRTVFVTLMSGASDAMSTHARTLNAMVLEWAPLDRHWAVRKPLPWSKDNAKDLDAFADKIARELHVPGLAYAVVEDGKVAHERLLGVKQLGKPAALRRETTFLIGSLSKALSSLLVASLIDAKKLGWDSKLALLLPDFRLKDAALTERLQLQHAFCACTGLPRRDLPLAFEYGTTTPEAVLGTLRDLEPVAAFGETFQYSNQMVGSGGFAAAHVAFPNEPIGVAYERAMASHVFGPMGMKHATVSFAKGVAGDHAAPHAEQLDPIQMVAMPAAVERFVTPWAPAGAVWASIADMEQYLLTELGEGKAPNGTQVVSKEQIRRRRARGVKIGPHAWYGLGLGVGEHFGLTEIEHSGATFGMSSKLMFHPDTGRGIVVLANVADGLAASLLARRALELAYGDAQAEPTLARALVAQRENATKSAARWLPSDTSTASNLVGRYRNPRLGTLIVTAAPAPALVWIDAGEWKARARLSKTETGMGNQLVLIDPPIAGLAFTPTLQDLTVVLGAEQETFTRVP